MGEGLNKEPQGDGRVIGFGKKGPNNWMRRTPHN
jgi:hypothetical protein